MCPKKKVWKVQRMQSAEHLDIIAESISDEAAYRTWIREIDNEKREGLLLEAKDPRRQSLFTRCIMSSKSRCRKLAGHRILALNRGEKEKFLTVKIEAPEEEIIQLSGEER